MLNLKKLADDRYQVHDVTTAGAKLLVTAVHHKRKGWRFRCDVDKLTKFDRLGDLMEMLRSFDE